ncbi:MAG: DNA starvation/stationary phase protection protein [Acidimicrobiales bacterium]|nr:MAG: DNA starvation/stationary phase protection protein [Acidimicrobiales bacterium]
MVTIDSAITGGDREIVANVLQAALVDLVDVSLQAKQAHWNVTGPTFRSLHLQLDEVVTLAREHADVVAERAAALGISPDGRVKTLADSVQTPQLDSGYLQAELVAESIAALLLMVVYRFRDYVEQTDEADPVTQDLLIAATQGLEQQHWMFQAMTVES